jgi:hypothetical protein
MSQAEDLDIINVYYPPESIDTNMVGRVEIARGDIESIIHSVFLDRQFGKDVIITGRLLREKRTKMAAHHACSRIRFQAEGQLGSEVIGQLAIDPDLT